jgi:hypothetical protein
MKVIRVLVPVFAITLTCSMLASAQGTVTSPTKTAPVVKAADPAASLPPAVLAAFKQAYPKAVIKNAAKETENGKTTWEVESTDGGLARDLVYNPDGTVVDIEEEVTVASLPAVVMATVKATYPKATITKAEKLIRGEKWTYELTLKGAAKPSIELTPDGKVVAAAKPPEK